MAYDNLPAEEKPDTSSEKAQMKAQLLEESEQVLRQMKARRWNHVLLAVGLFVGLDGFLLLLRMGGAKRSVLHDVASFIMTLNGIISSYLLIQPLFLARAAQRAMRRGMDDLRSGKLTVEEYGESFLPPAREFVSHTFPYFLFIHR